VTEIQRRPPLPTGERRIDHWNYRVFCEQVPDGIGGTVEQFTIREAYYDDTDSRPHSWTAEPSTPFGETKLALMEDVTAMASAISSPVLYLGGNGEIASEEVRRGSLRR
jgi:hypothetical protein